METAIPSIASCTILTRETPAKVIPHVNPKSFSTTSLNLPRSSSLSRTLSAARMKISGRRRLSCGRLCKYPSTAALFRGKAKSRSLDKENIVKAAIIRNRGPGKSAITWQIKMAMLTLGYHRVYDPKRCWPR